MAKDQLTPGLAAEIETVVDDKLVVRHMGGAGVLSTPSMIALMERAGIQAVQDHLPEGHTTVGFEVNVKHFGATPKGRRSRSGPSSWRSTAASFASRSRRAMRTRRSARAPIAGRSFRCRRRIERQSAPRTLYHSSRSGSGLKPRIF